MTVRRRKGGETQPRKYMYRLGSLHIVHPSRFLLLFYKRCRDTRGLLLRTTTEVKDQVICHVCRLPSGNNEVMLPAAEAGVLEGHQHPDNSATTCFPIVSNACHRGPGTGASKPNIGGIQTCVLRLRMGHGRIGRMVPTVI